MLKFANHIHNLDQLPSARPLLIYGSGKRGQDTLAEVRNSRPDIDIKGYLDSFSSGQVDATPVYQIDDSLTLATQSSILIASEYWQVIASKLDALHLDYYIYYEPYTKELQPILEYCKSNNISEDDAQAFTAFASYWADFLPNCDFIKQFCFNYLRKHVDPAHANEFAEDIRFKDFCKHYDQYYSGEGSCRFVENGETMLIKACALDDAIIFDIGANIGEWSEAVCKHNPNTQVHAFEPSSANFKKLETKVGHFPNLHINQCAVGNSEETLEFFHYEGLNTSSSLYDQSSTIPDNRELKTHAVETVACITIDTYCKNKNIDCIDFLKIDAEGNELKILQGAKASLLEKKIKTVLFEYNYTYVASRTYFKDAWDFSNECGYSIYLLREDNSLQLITAYSINLENFVYKNFLLSIEDNPIIQQVSDSKFKICER